MQVFFDVSALGGARVPPFVQGGIYRFVESLATALVESRECSLTFTAVHKPLRRYAYSEVEDLFKLRNVPFPHPQIRQRLFARGIRVNDSIAETNGMQQKYFKALRQLLHFFSVSIDRTIPEKSCFDEISIKQPSVFHSTFFSMPDLVRKNDKLRPFLTVYDLLPLIHPEFFTVKPEDGSHELVAILDGIKETDWITCISQSTKEDLCSYRPDLDPDRITITYLGASDWFFPCDDEIRINSVRQKYKIPPGLYALSVCTLEPRKNLAHLIRCFLRMVQEEKMADHYLVLVGSFGWKFESILSELTKVNGYLRDRIILTGRVEDEDLGALYSGATFFVYPSLYEGFGLPPLEAMQCGVPVITSNSSSLPEVVGSAAIMVDPTDEDELCNAMTRIFLSESLRESLSVKSISRASEFSWERCARETTAAYRRAIDFG